MSEQDYLDASFRSFSGGRDDPLTIDDETHRSRPMTPPDRAPEPLSAEEEALYREGMRDAPTISEARPESASLAWLTIAEWADRCRRLLATLDAARDPRPVGGHTWAEHIGCDPTICTVAHLARDSRPVGNRVMSDRWWTDGAMVNIGEAGDEGFVGDAATEDDAQRIVEAHNASIPRDSRPLLARWPEADLFAALDAEGWFRGLETREATAATAKVYARLARESRPVGEGLPDELAVGNWPSGGGRVTKYDDATWVNDAGGAWVLLYAPRQFYDGLRRLATDQPASTEAGEDG